MIKTILLFGLIVALWSNEVFASRPIYGMVSGFVARLDSNTVLLKMGKRTKTVKRKNIPQEADLRPGMFVTAYIPVFDLQGKLK